MSSRTVHAPHVMFALGQDRYTTGTGVTLSYDQDEYVLTIDNGQIAMQVPLSNHDMALLLSCVEGGDV